MLEIAARMVSVVIILQWLFPCLLHVGNIPAFEIGCVQWSGHLALQDSGAGAEPRGECYSGQHGEWEAGPSAAVCGAADLYGICLSASFDWVACLVTSAMLLICVVFTPDHPWGVGGVGVEGLVPPCCWWPAFILICWGGGWGGGRFYLLGCWVS